ncbi:MAG TPA: sugar transferase [Methylomirabilota bacterium]|nr:sugar transferase [Methylomirabilota bacterium]
MISHRLKGLYSLFITSQVIMSQALFWAHFLFMSSTYSEVPRVSSYFIYSILAGVGLVVEALGRADVGVDWRAKSVVEKHHVALRQTLYASGAIVFFLAATKDQVISRVFLFSYLLMLYALLLVTARNLPKWVTDYVFARSRRARTLLVGAMARADALNEWIASKPLLGFEVVGAVSDETVAPGLQTPMLGGMKEFEGIVVRNQINQAILLEPCDDAAVTKIVSACERLGVRFLVVSDLHQRFHGKVIFSELDGFEFIAVRQEPLENPVNRAAKRVLDIVIATPMVLLALPIATAVVWIVQRLQSPGPLLYAQNRAGMQQKPFRIYKFRTMHPASGDAARQATRGDSRIFPAGRWLRKFSIDELPQFWNVLQGEMSVVGPRPHLAEHNEWFARVMHNYHVRALVKPGITGLAQVRGFRGEAKDEAMLRKRIESDIYYIENWSFGVDIIIIFRTFWHMIRPPKTAY